MSIRSWSTTPSANSASPPNGWPEGMAPSGVNNSARQMMADIRETLEALPFFDYGDTPTRIDADTFTIPTDLTARYVAGLSVKLIGATTQYGTITSSSYSAPDTTVNISGTVPTSLVTVSIGLAGSSTRYEQTAAELAAGVTPINYSKWPSPWSDISRFVSDNTGASDVSTGFQAAIDAHSRIIIPRGTYKITTTLRATSGHILRMEGEDWRESIINWTGGASEILYCEAITEPHLEGFRIDNNGSATVAIQSDSLNTSIHKIYMSPINPLTTAMIQSRTDDAVEHWSIRDCILSGYTDGGGDHRSERGIWLHTGNGFDIANVFFDDLKTNLQAGKTAGVGVDSGIINSLSVHGGCQFQGHVAGTSDIGIDLYHVQGAEISGNYFRFSDGVVSPNHLGVKCRNAQGIKISGNFFSGDGQQEYAVQANDSNCHNISVEDNIFNRIALAGVHNTAGTEVWARNNRLDTTAAQIVQTTNEATPGITFGGGSTGITYAARASRFYRDGNVCFWEGTISLSNKGSSTGTVRITGAPYVSANISGVQPVGAIGVDAMSSIAGNIYVIMSTNVQELRIFQGATGTSAELDNSNFTNSSVIFFSIKYIVKDV